MKCECKVTTKKWNTEKQANQCDNLSFKELLLFPYMSCNMDHGKHNHQEADLAVYGAEV